MSFQFQAPRSAIRTSATGRQCQFAASSTVAQDRIRGDAGRLPGPGFTADIRAAASRM